MRLILLITSLVFLVKEIIFLTVKTWVTKFKHGHLSSDSEHSVTQKTLFGKNIEKTLRKWI